jgi:predicted DNA-binding transcriptional regulator AlpA
MEVAGANARSLQLKSGGDKKRVDTKIGSSQIREVRLVLSSKLQDHLAYPPRGMRAPRAAAYVGVSPSTFLTLVSDGLMPKPKRVRGMVLWDRFELDAAFESLGPEQRDEPKRRNTFDTILGIDTTDGERS